MTVAPSRLAHPIDVPVDGGTSFRAYEGQPVSREHLPSLVERAYALANSSDSTDTRAYSMFLRGEVDIVGAVEKERDVIGQGIANDHLLIGRWAVAPTGGLWVRAGLGEGYLSLALHQETYGGRTDHGNSWFIDARLDHREGAFFSLLCQGSNVSIRAMPAIIEIGNRFITSLSGYKEIAKSRSPVKIS
jgi:hypothetical protein